MTFKLKTPTTSLLVPWAYMPSSWGYREITEDDMDAWYKREFQNLQQIVPDAVAVRPLIRGTRAVYAVRRGLLEAIS